MKKKKSNSKAENTDLKKLQKLEKKLKKIQSRPHAMTSEEFKIVEEIKESINLLNK